MLNTRLKRALECTHVHLKQDVACASNKYMRAFYLNPKQDACSSAKDVHVHLRVPTNIFLEILDQKRACIS